MKRINFYAVLILGIGLIQNPNQSHCAEITPSIDSPQKAVEEIVRQAKLLGIPAKKKEAAATIESLVDFTGITSAAMRHNEKRVSNSQKKEIEVLLKTILTRTVYPQASQFFSDVTIEYTKEKTEDNLVRSIVSKNGKRTTVEYTLKPSSRGFLIADLSVEGESWVENVQIQFDEIIQKKGVSELIDRMKKRAAELKRY